MELALSVALGVGLAAACGFRVFVPFTIMSIAALSGYLHLSPDFAWIGTYPALLAFSTATVLEIMAYYVPWLDHAPIRPSPHGVARFAHNRAAVERGDAVQITPFLRCDGLGATPRDVPLEARHPIEPF